MKTQKVAICKPSSEASGETGHVDTSILDFQPSELWEINFCCLRQRCLTFLAPGIHLVEDNFSTAGEDAGGGVGTDKRRSSGCNTSQSLASLPVPLLTSCWFLTGHRLVLLCGPGVEDTTFKPFSQWYFVMAALAIYPWLKEPLSYM